VTPLQALLLQRAQAAERCTRAAQEAQVIKRTLRAMLKNLLEQGVPVGELRKELRGAGLNASAISKMLAASGWQKTRDPPPNPAQLDMFHAG